MSYQCLRARDGQVHRQGTVKRGESVWIVVARLLPSLFLPHRTQVKPAGEQTGDEETWVRMSIAPSHLVSQKSWAKGYEEHYWDMANRRLKTTQMLMEMQGLDLYKPPPEQILPIELQVQVDIHILQLERAFELHASVKAAAALGHKFLLGEAGVQLDKEKAKLWYQRAAAQGDQHARLMVHAIQNGRM